jgi:hypothetical protein
MRSRRLFDIEIMLYLCITITITIIIIIIKYLAAKFVEYAGEPEQYFTFFSAEAYHHFFFSIIYQI